MVDIVVLGATGYTGRLIAQYLATHSQRSSFTFSLAARSQSALEKVFRELNLSKDDVPAFIVDVTNCRDVDTVVQQARVVINTIGPYWRWGTSVVRACVHHGKHYVDLTGEVHWIKDIIFEFDYAAVKSGSIVVPCCGLDSVPSDILAFVANKTLKSFGGPSTAVDLSTSAWKLGGASISGGTFSTILTALEEVPKQKMRESTRNFALSPVNGAHAPRPRILYTLPYSDRPIYGAWYFMAITNSKVVQRSWGLYELARRTNHPDATAVTPFSYGPDFKYEEFVVLPSPFYAVMYSIILATIATLLVHFQPARWLARRIMPGPGEGPSEKQLKDGSIKITNITTSSPNSQGERIVVRSIFRGRGDPGYFLSSIMISECALALALDSAMLPQISAGGGILTPMTAFGDVLVERLRKSGHIDIERAQHPIPTNTFRIPPEYCRITMERIEADPALEAQPNFESAAYRGWLNALLNGGATREEALAQMAEGWGLERQERIEAWQQQKEDEARELQERMERDRAEKEAEEQEERREAEKKKPKMNDFDVEATVADVIIPRPSQYAIQKVKNMEYVELWYFSPDGCREAAATSRSTSDSDDAFGFARVDGMVALKTIASFKASQKAVQDHDLSWRQFDLAKTSFLVHIEKNNWPEKHQQALALFFTLITNHEHRMRPRGEKTLLRYAGFVRREWHDRLAQNQGFNIGIFNNALYSTISDDVWEAERDESLRMLHNSVAVSNAPRFRGREANESRGKRAEPPSPSKNNRYHPYRSEDQVVKKTHKGQQSFQAGTSLSGPSACALCLGRFRHPIHKCSAEFLWDKRTKTRCRRSTEGHLVNPEGLELCYDWQRPKGCSSTARSHVHECSGCGAKDHGAQECPQSESI